MNANTLTSKNAQGVVMIAAALAIVGFVVVERATAKPERYDEETWCSLDKPVAGHVAILVDRTDAFTKRHVQQLRNAVEIAKANLPTGARVTIHLVTSDPYEAETAIFDKCNPGDGSKVNVLKQDPARVQKRYEESFAKPLNDLIAKLEKAQTEAESPIIESIAAVAGVMGDVSPNKKRIILISDLLQHSGTVSHYGPSDPEADFAAAEAADLGDGRLKGVAVEIVYLKRKEDDGRQSTAHLRRWERLLSKNGAVLDANAIE